MQILDQPEQHYGVLNHCKTKKSKALMQFNIHAVVKGFGCDLI